MTLVLAAPAVAAPSNVTVRIEGAGSTLVEEAGFRTTTAPVNKRNQGACSGTSGAGALEQATGGDWDGTYYSSFSDYALERIFGETYTFSDPEGDYWAFWLNGRSASAGICSTELQEGDSVLFYVDRCTGFPCANEPVRPLELSAPASARPGTPVTVSVATLDGSGGSSATPQARVTGDGVDVETGSDGKATVTFPRAGQYALKASKNGSVRSAREIVSVSAPGEAPPAADQPQGPAARDSAAPVGRIAGIREQQRFTRRKTPRTLRGSVAPDPSGLKFVKLSLTRSAGGRCQLYSPSKERFRRSRCGGRVNFSIGDRQDWSYLLPRKLARGRYVLDVIAIDKLGNRDQLARGRNRVVFFVR